MEKEGISIGRELARETEKRQEFIARLIVAMDRNWNLKSLLEQALEEAQQDEGYRQNKPISEQERLQQQRILEKESRIRKEEKKYRES